MKLKFIEEKFFNGLMVTSTMIVFAFVGSIIWIILTRGLPALSWDMITKLPSGGFYLDGGGGILNAIVGSLLIVSGSTIVGLVVSVHVIFYINVFLPKDSKLSYFIRLSFDVLYGIPSIVYGAFAFIIMTFFGLKASLLGGILVITLLVIPIFVRSMDEVAKSVSKDLLDSIYSLGATKSEAGMIIGRQIAPGIITATLLSIGRAIGDTAGVMFTAGFTDNIPVVPWRDQAATLPLSVFFQLSSPIPEVREHAYAAALLLTIIVLLLSLSGRLAVGRLSRNKIN
ncbi:MAG: phosphate ABC transporter permease PstA [Candidatus Azobacteroides pseudotrichonymphae]|jgi:phosphate transport system permease protein|nr:MAG: phosphate ABC transporter permease PstA [Candidatus Azobacteroides pseudotrichonymphae]